MKSKSPSINIEDFIQASIQAANTVTSLLPEGMHLKYENTFSRMLIISKKKYAGIHASNSKLYIKGIDIVKKNTCMFIRDYYKIFLYMILYDYPKKYIGEKVLKMKSDLLSGRVPMEKLVMKLSVGRKYISSTYPVLLFVNNHKKHNLSYKSGEKVDYIIIDTSTYCFEANSKYYGDKLMSIDLYNNICEKMSSDHAVIKPMLDYEYYYDHHIKNGFKTLLSSYSKDISDLL